MLRYDFSEYTLRPFARDERHHPDRNGKAFKSVLDNFMMQGEPVDFYVPDLELSFSDSFVDASFCALIREHGKEKVFSIIRISDTEYGNDLKQTIEEVMSVRRGHHE